MPQAVCPGHYRRQVKPKPVHMKLLHPVAQAVGDKLPHVWVVAVEGVATAAVVVIFALGCQHVVDTVVQATVCVGGGGVDVCVG